VLVEEQHLRRVVIGRLARLGAAIDDDLMQHGELRAKPVLAREPLQIARVVDQDLSIRRPLYLPNGMTFMPLLASLIGVLRRLPVLSPGP
jgi:hypothetical protein